MLSDLVLFGGARGYLSATITADVFGGAPIAFSFLLLWKLAAQGHDLGQFGVVDPDDTARTKKLPTAVLSRIGVEVVCSQLAVKE